MLYSILSGVFTRAGLAFVPMCHGMGSPSETSLGGPLVAPCLHVEKEAWLENSSFCIHLSKIFCSLCSQLYVIHKKKCSNYWFLILFLHPDSVLCLPIKATQLESTFEVSIELKHSYVHLRFKKISRHKSLNPINLVETRKWLTLALCARHNSPQLFSTATRRPREWGGHWFCKWHGPYNCPSPTLVFSDLILCMCVNMSIIQSACYKNEQSTET